MVVWYGTTRRHQKNSTKLHSTTMTGSHSRRIALMAGLGLAVLQVLWRFEWLTNNHPQPLHETSNHVHWESDSDTTPTAAPSMISTRPLMCSGNRLANIPGTKKDGTTIRKLWTFYSQNWGNVLSPYWAARIEAELGGYNYVDNVFGKKSWMQYLPTTVPAKQPRPTEFERFCNCYPPGKSYEYYHGCPFGWGETYRTIRNDTRNALKHFSAERPREEQDLVFDFFGPNDWLIYDRCNLLDHYGHGFGTLSTYNVIPTTGAFTVYTISGRMEGLGAEFCPKFHQIRNDYIRQRIPRVRVISLEQSEQMWVDFARLVFAPNLLLPSAGSSWTLWASLANNGSVKAVPFGRSTRSPVYPDNFEIVNATILYPPQSDSLSAQLLGFNDSKIATTPQGEEALLRCYRFC